jgi:hypothetical protein
VAVGLSAAHAGTVVEVKLPVGTGGAGVWTGKELVVWGGRKAGWKAHERGDDVKPAPTNQGWRYDPGTDASKPISDRGAPAARDGAVAVWTGKEMFVWGGAATTQLKAQVNVNDPSKLPVLGPSLGSGGLYNPAADTWRAVPTPPKAQANGRMWATGVWTGSEVVIWGGMVIGPGVRDGVQFEWHETTEGLAFDPKKQTWRTLASKGAPPSKRGQIAVWTGTEVLVLGPDVVAGYNPTKDTWRTLAAPIAGVSINPSTAYVWTGSQLRVLSPVAKAGNAVGLYTFDPATNTWSVDALDKLGCWMQGRAVWTGTRILAFYATGGSFGGCEIDPRAKTARALTTSNVDQLAAGPEVAVWTGSRAIVWGGTSTSHDAQSEMYRPAEVRPLGAVSYTP